MAETSDTHFVFPKWINWLLPTLIVCVLGGGVYKVLLVPYALEPNTLNVGYAPDQPIPFSHAVHAGELGMDCRYCHTTVDKAAMAAIPPTQTCWNCHNDKAGVHKTSEKLAPLRASAKTGDPVEWVLVHDLADYAYFNHAAHVNAGVSCVQCHGRVDKMEVVTQVENLSMSWCLDCHRDPGPNLWPKDKVYDLDWQPPTGKEREDQIARLMEENKIKSQRQMTDCSVCHR